MVNQGNLTLQSNFLQTNYIDGATPCYSGQRSKHLAGANSWAVTHGRRGVEGVHAGNAMIISGGYRRLCFRSLHVIDTPYVNRHRPAFYFDPSQRDHSL
jgi:hypothetical protein